MSAQRSLAVGLLPEGWPSRALPAENRTPISTGNRRSENYRRWRGTGSFPGPQPDAGLGLGALVRARLALGVLQQPFSPVFRGAGAGVRSFGTTGPFTKDVFQVTRLKNSATAYGLLFLVLDLTGRCSGWPTWPGGVCKVKCAGRSVTDPKALKPPI